MNYSVKPWGQEALSNGLLDTRRLGAIKKAKARLIK
jgi:hypothetical protein